MFASSKAFGVLIDRLADQSLSSCLSLQLVFAEAARISTFFVDFVFC
jgi:hypothetical protein